MVAQVLRGQWLRIFHTDLEVTEVSPTQGDFTVKFIFARSDAQQLDQVGQDSVLNAWEARGGGQEPPPGAHRSVLSRVRNEQRREPGGKQGAACT